ncbi:MAG: hypothetical protein H7328_08325 [Bdellovibrio sp.]|nr:hypothetical protein [Bdellovibrio sp.]
MAWADTSHANEITSISKIGTGSEATTVSAQSYGDVSSEKVAEIIHEAELTNADTMVVSDHPEVMKLTAKAYEETKNPAKLKFMPLGILTKMSAKARIEFSDYLARANETIRTDKVTLIVLTITTAVDSFIWIQATSMSFPQKLSMVSLNMLFAVTFGLDRDLWGKMTMPIHHKMMKTFDRLGGAKVQISRSGQIIASQFVSNLTMGTAFYVLRAGLISFDHIETLLISTAFWAQTMKLTTMMSLTQFAWAELYNKVDAKVNPVAKLNLKRIADTRGILLTSLASISMVFQPEIYGNTPIITFIVHGAVGLTALLGAEKIISVLETSKPSNLLYKYSNKFEDALKPAPSMLCRDLF